ncbi:MAG TPA: alpha/beta fold hydrolase [Actinomycetes bacterium]|nr:alpha/beta fold hydrolase [Actinomycetes bacterium]
MSTNQPRWEQRIHRPQLIPFSLTAPAVSWAKQVSNRGVLLATCSGRAEVHTFDATTTPATLRQVTDRPQGTTAGGISSDGEHVLWFDDHDGDEVGRWQRLPFDSGGDAVTLLADLPPTFTAGVIATPTTTYLGRLTNDGLAVATADAAGNGGVIVAFPEMGELVDVSKDGSLALVSFAPDGDWLHQGIRVVRLADGVVTAELRDPGLALSAVGFSPTGSADEMTVLVTHERNNRDGILLWSPETGAEQQLELDRSGDLSASWFPDGQRLLITRADIGRHSLHAYNLASQEITDLATPTGTIFRSSARPDGTVHALVSDAATPPKLIRLDDGPIVDLGDPPPPSVPSQDVFADGPGGQVHALLLEPEGRQRPHPTVFVVHGGPTGQDFDAFHVSIAAIVDAGYAVVRVNYRGSTGYGATWRDALHTRLGFTELEDISAIRVALEERGIVDGNQVAMAGGSWGGYLTLFALGVEPDRWQCGAAAVPLADWFIAHEDQQDFMTKYDESLMGGSIKDMPEEYRVASPITYVDDVKAPLFITAGANDPRCPPRQIDGYVERLRGRGHDVTYERWDSGHALYDMTAKAREIRGILSFLEAKMPIASQDASNA